MGSERTKHTIQELIDEGVITAHKDGNYGAMYPRQSEFGDTGVLFITAKLVSDQGFIDFENAPRLNNEKAEKLTFGYIESKDVLLSHNATVGRVAITPELTEPVLVGTSLTYFRTDSERLSPEYFAAYLTGVDFQNELKAVMGLSTRNQVPITTQRKLEVVIPPLSEQKAIAHILGTLDDKIELNRRMNATLEGMAQALFKSWFVDFDPVIDNALAAGNPIPDELAARAEVRRQALANGTTNREAAKPFPAAFQKTESMGWIPEGWEAGCIAELCSAVTDGSHHSPKSVDKESGLPMASSKDLSDLGINYECCRFISRHDFSELERNGCSPQVGDVLIAKDGARCGETCCIHGEEDPVVLLSSVAILRPKSPNLSTFLNTLLSRAESVADLRENYVSGSAIPRIILRDFKRFPVVTFPSPILEKWVQHSQVLHQKAADAREQSQTQSRLRDTLLPKLISGELRIPKAEKLSKEALA